MTATVLSNAALERKKSENPELKGENPSVSVNHIIR